MFGGKRKKASVEFQLNISSLMDIMTILLLFLLMSFESQDQKTDPPEDIVLPVSASELPVKLAVKVSISTEEVRVEEAVVLKLQGGKLKSKDIDKNLKIKPLLKVLKRHKARLQSGAATQKVGDEDESEIVYFEAAKGTKYGLINQAMMTAAEAGFSKFRLAVNRKF